MNSSRTLLNEKEKSPPNTKLLNFSFPFFFSFQLRSAKFDDPRSLKRKITIKTTFTGVVQADVFCLKKRFPGNRQRGKNDAGVP